MIYFDSAATTLQKPASVPAAVADAIDTMTTPGRGDHPAARMAADLMLRCRMEAAELFDVPTPENVILTSNATHGLNIAIRSLVSSGDTVVISGYEHNAVTRPLRDIGRVSCRIVNGRLFDPRQMIEGFRRAVDGGVKAVICTHTSNVFGYTLPMDEIAGICRERGVPLIVDAARMLAGVHRNLFIVGDPDQTIYSWRGADVNLFLDFDKVYRDARTIVLDANYRSTPQIIGASNALVAHNACRYPKELHAVSPDGVLPVFYHGRSERDEAKWITSKIRQMVDAGWKLSDIAILYRAHHLSRPLEDSFIKNAVPYKIYSGTAFYARREVKDVVAYLRMLTIGDDLAFMRTVNTPSRKIGKKKMAMIQAEAARHGDRMIDALRRLASTPAFASTGAMDYLSAIDTASGLVGTVSLGDLLQRVLDLSGYEEMLRGLSEWERLDNLAELKRAIEEAGHDDDATLDEFLTRVALVSNIDRDNESSEAVRMMTVHTAKGMEFPAVFVCGLSEGSMPSRRSSGPDDIEEERRLAYVALTRARHLLFMSDSEGFGHDNTAKSVSRFVYEIGLERMSLERPLPPPPQACAPMAGAGDKGFFQSGDLVEHPVFGRGMIMEVNHDRQAYLVQFDKIATPRSLRFGAPLDAVAPDKWI